MRKRIAFGVLILGIPLAFFLAFRSIQAEIPLAALKDARLKTAYQQDWQWNYHRTRERKRTYETAGRFDAVVASVRKELLERGWTEHRVPSSNPIHLFREKPGGYHISLQSYHPGIVEITVAEPQRPATLPLKVLSVLQGFDRRYRDPRQGFDRRYRDPRQGFETP